MRTDTVVKNEGVNALLKVLGKVDAERFIALMLREPFDYTEWQYGLFEDKSIEEICQRAMEYRRNKMDIQG